MKLGGGGAYLALPYGVVGDGGAENIYIWARPVCDRPHAWSCESATVLRSTEFGLRVAEVTIGQYGPLWGRYGVTVGSLRVTISL